MFKKQPMTNETLILSLFNFLKMIECLPMKFCVWTFMPYTNKKNFCVLFNFMFGYFVIVFKYGRYLWPIFFF
jgi:hypothetical protein